jgi:PEGA domain
MKAIVCALLLCALSGCATITRGTGEVLLIETDPVGAEVDIMPGGIRCITPCSIELKRKKDYGLEIRKDGYEPVKVSVLSQIVGSGAAGMAGNVILGGLIGAGVDAMSGATKGLKPNPVKVTMVRLQPAPIPVPVATPPVQPAVIPVSTQPAAQPVSDVPSTGGQ